MADILLSVQSLTKRFGAVQASNDLSLEVAAGEVHALIGPNGAGKTTARFISTAGGSPAWPSIDGPVWDWRGPTR